MSNYKYSNVHTLSTTPSTLIQPLPSFVMNGMYNLQVRNTGVDDARIGLIGADGGVVTYPLPANDGGISLDRLPGSVFVGGMQAYAASTNTTIWVGIVPQDRTIEIPPSPAEVKAIEGQILPDEQYENGFQVVI